MSRYQIVDVEHWERSMHCEIFRSYRNPRYSVSFEVDVTHFYEVIKEKGWSFTLAMIYTITRAANEVINFRYRFEEGKVVLYEDLNTSFTYLNQETQLMKNVVVPMQEGMSQYLQIAKAAIEAQKVYFTGPMGNDIYQFSAIPWISFTHISHTDPGKKDQATPIFDWGKWYMKDGKRMMPFSVEAHHSFVDGVHMGQFTEQLQIMIDQVENF